MTLPSADRIQPPRFAPQPFGLFPLPPELLGALEAEVATLTFAPVSEVPVDDGDYGSAVVGGLSDSRGAQPSIGHAPGSQALYDRFYEILTPRIGVLEARLAALIGVDPTCSEPLQGQRCDRGQYFRAHTDWFEPGSQEFIEHTALGGQRTWTVMVYLNPVAAGGQTRFLHLGRTFTPVRGMGLAWNNLHADGSPNPATLHESLPVAEGFKYVITK